jgi:hypothetical protein
MTPRELAQELANQIPAARWMSYGDLADAYNAVCAQYGLRALPERTGAKLMGSNLLNDVPSTDTTDDYDHPWNVPWSRIRDANGRCRARWSGEVTDPHNPGNERYRAEGGWVDGKGGAAMSQRMTVAELVKRYFGGSSSSPASPTGQPPNRSTGTVSPERPAAMEARLAERRR